MTTKKWKLKWDRCVIRAKKISIAILQGTEIKRKKDLKGGRSFTEIQARYIEGAD